MTLTRYPFPIGTVVAFGNETGKVTAIPGPYSVTVDNRLTLSVTKITQPAHLTSESHAAISTDS